MILPTGPLKKDTPNFPFHTHNSKEIPKHKLVLKHPGAHLPGGPVGEIFELLLRRPTNSGESELSDRPPRFSDEWSLLRFWKGLIFPTCLYACIHTEWTHGIFGWFYKLKGIYTVFTYIPILYYILLLLVLYVSHIWSFFSFLYLRTRPPDKTLKSS